MNRNPKFEEMYTFKLEGIKCMYPRLFQPDTKFESVWKVDLILPQKLADEMAAVGFNVRQKDYGDGEVNVITAKRKTHKRNGDPMYPPNVYDADAARWDEAVAIGNGSVLNVQVAAQYREVGGKTRLPLYLNAVQVVELVPYHGSPFSKVGGDSGGEENPFA